MNRNVIKFLIVSVILIIIIITIMLIVIIKTNFKSDVDVEIAFAKGDPGEEIKYDELHNVEDKVKYYIVRNCINNYLETLNNKNELYYIEGNYNKNYQNEFIYNLLNKTYIKNNNITQSNALENITSYDEQLLFVPIEMQVIENANKSVYIAYGIIVNADNTYNEEKYIAVGLDAENETYDILPLEENYKNISEIKIKNENIVIEENNCNKYVTPDITEKYLADEYINLYKMIVLAKPEIVYNSLLQEYKEKRFPQLQDFEQYIIRNSDIIRNIEVSNYNVNYYDYYIEYVETDQYGNVYIFQEDGEFNYKLQLDSYTIKNDKFVQEYEKYEDVDKGMTNIRKFLEMINMQDYETAYNVLDNNFKQTYFPTLQEFISYIQNKIFRYNVISSGYYNSDLPKMYVYKLNLVDATGKSSGQIQFNIIMKLKEGTDFVMSFEI